MVVARARVRLSPGVMLSTLRSCREARSMHAAAHGATAYRLSQRHWMATSWQSDNGVGRQNAYEAGRVSPRTSSPTSCRPTPERTTKPRDVNSVTVVYSARTVAAAAAAASRDEIQCSWTMRELLCQLLPDCSQQQQLYVVSTGWLVLTFWTR